MEVEVTRNIYANPAVIGVEPFPFGVDQTDEYGPEPTEYVKGSPSSSDTNYVIPIIAVCILAFLAAGSIGILLLVRLYKLRSANNETQAAQILDPIKGMAALTDEKGQELPETVISKTAAVHELKECPICFEEPDTGEVWVDSICAHSFHLSCCASWHAAVLSTSLCGGCPKCRAPFVATRKLRVIDDNISSPLGEPMSSSRPRTPSAPPLQEEVITVKVVD
mmetsp:Transcript_10918/g.40084  ORF Transcript_10918/g.40084 Transcript_10918/m.40084 type:complete len:222 (+) Transcript_10918:3-668(+)